MSERVSSEVPVSLKGKKKRSGVSKVKVLEGELRTLRDDLLRALAEQQNIRARERREREQQRLLTIAQIVRPLCDILDNFDRALSSVKTQDKALKEGLLLIYKQFMEFLSSQDIVAINPEGEVFDAYFHEAISYKESEVVPQGTILEVLQQGYCCGDYLIRAARVVVSKGK